MALLHYILATFLFSCTSLVNSKSLPPYITPCKRNDPNLEECVKDLIHSLRPRLADGIPDLAVPKLEPFRVPILVFDHGNEAVQFHATFKNVVAYGASNFTVTQAKINFDVPTVLVKVHFPRLKINTDYNINGKVILVPIKGVGKLDANFTDVDVRVFITGKYVTKDDEKTYLSIVNRTMRIEMGDLKIYFSSLFDGNKELTRTTNLFVNENWREVIDEIYPLIEDTAGQFMVLFLKGFLNTFSFDELFPV